MNVYPIKCRISAQADVTRVDVYDDIGEGGWFSEGVTAKSFAAQLAGVKGTLEVHINSGGGDVFDGIAIGNAIGAHKGKVTTVVDGLAASIASVIAQAGHERVVQPGSMLMVHDAFGMCVGNAGEMKQFAGTLDKVSDNIASIYADRSGGDASEWRKVMKTEAWYTAEEAVAAGLADRVGDGAAELPAGLDLAAYAVPGRIAAALRSLPRAAATAPAAEQSCADLGHQCCQDAQARSDADIRALIRDELHIANAAVDESSWDGPAAMSAAAKSDNPAAALAAICAGRRDGDPKTEAAHALPHHKHAGDPPNRHGVTAALGRIGGTQGLTNKSAAQAHLDAHQKAMGDGDGDADDHSHAGFAWSGPDKFRASLERKASEH